MSQKTKIAILGTGAVGGYFGGMLAKKYLNSPEVEVTFIVRPATEKIIKERGLKIITDKTEQIVFPDQVTSNPENAGKIDLLLCCVKSYDLEESLKPLTTNITTDTIILPLLNGVDAGERIKQMFPETEVWDGCVYIVTRLIEPGIIKDMGNIHSLYFGSEKGSVEKLTQVENIFKNAEIDVFRIENISQTIWEKFLFISPLASLTSFLNLTIGPIINNNDHKKMLLELLSELRAVANAKGIYFNDNIIEATIRKMERLPYDTTSSMHSDFRKGGKTEYKSLTEYVVKLGKELNLNTPVYGKVLTGLSKK